MPGPEGDNHCHVMAKLRPMKATLPVGPCFSRLANGFGTTIRATFFFVFGNSDNFLLVNNRFEGFCGCLHNFEILSPFAYVPLFEKTRHVNVSFFFTPRNLQLVQAIPFVEMDLRGGGDRAVAWEARGEEWQGTDAKGVLAGELQIPKG